MPRSVGMTGSKWFTCDRCGFDYPVKFLRRQQSRQVCTYLPCFDKILDSDDPTVDLSELDDLVDAEVVEDVL